MNKYSDNKIRFVGSTTHIMTKLLLRETLPDFRTLDSVEFTKLIIVMFKFGKERDFSFECDERQKRTYLDLVNLLVQETKNRVNSTVLKNEIKAELLALTEYLQKNDI